MNEVDIFSLGEPTTGKFFSFKNVGDSINGTYIGSSDGIDSYNNEQRIFKIKDSDGQVWNIGIRKSNKILIEDMAEKSLGDIIGLRFDEEKESKKFSGNLAKIIRVYPYKTKGPVDEKWLAERKEIEAKLNGFNGVQAPNTTVYAPKEEVVAEAEVKVLSNGVAQQAPQAPQEESNDAFDAIRNLAMSKGLVTPDMDKATANKKIEEYTGVALSEDKFSQIIIKLTGYTQ